MANDRTYAYCEKCNQVRFLAKRMGGLWYSGRDDEEACDLIPFMNEHRWCGAEVRLVREENGTYPRGAEITSTPASR